MSDDAQVAAAPAPSGVSPIFIGLVAAFVLCGAGLAMGALGGVGVFAFVLIGWMLSLCLHEWGHAFTAWKGGDSSILGKGYLTLDPLRYSDPYVSILLPLAFLALGGIGFPGGAVYVNNAALRGPLWRSGVSAAGPAMTFACLALIGIVFLADVLDPQNPLTSALAFLALLEAMALILNLLPIPGLDGFGILEGVLPARVNRLLAPLKPLAMILIFAVIFLVPAVFYPVWALARDLCFAFGVDGASVSDGYERFRFWNPQ